MGVAWFVTREFWFWQCLAETLVMTIYEKVSRSSHARKCRVFSSRSYLSHSQTSTKSSGTQFIYPPPPESFPRPPPSLRRRRRRRRPHSLLRTGPSSGACEAPSPWLPCSGPITGRLGSTDIAPNHSAAALVTRSNIFHTLGRRCRRASCDAFYPWGRDIHALDPFMVLTRDHGIRYHGDGDCETGAEPSGI